MITLTQLRALLGLALHTSGPTPPAIARLGQSVTIEDVARAYLPRTIWRSWCDGEAEDYPTEHDIVNAGPDRMGAEWANNRLLDLTDPGTVFSVRAALTLARGFDPRNGVKWTRNGADNAWILDASDWCAFATSTAARSVTPSRRVIAADLVGAEPDPIKALVLAVEHVLKEKP